MDLFVMRHGEAVSQAGPDAQRQLTSLGREETLQVCLHLKKQFAIDTIFSSPYVRARQTAEIAQEVWSVSNRMESEHLTPLGEVVEALTELSVLSSTAILVVSHMPFVSDFVHYLSRSSPSVSVNFKTSGVAYLKIFEWKLRSGELQWLMDPYSISDK